VAARGILKRINPEGLKVLRQLALDREMTVQALMIEAANDLLRKYRRRLVAQRLHDHEETWRCRSGSTARLERLWRVRSLGLSGHQCCTAVMRAVDPGCVKTLRGITAPGILSSVVMRKAKKRKNLSSARHFDEP